MSPRFLAPSRQRGIALIVALLLLVVISLVGLSSIRNTTLQERMSANLYDRDLAFQVAESALRAAEAAIAANPEDLVALNGIDCRVSAAACPIVPATAWANDNTNWTNVPAAFQVSAGLVQGVPQYHIAWIGFDSGEDETTGWESAECQQQVCPPPIVRPPANFYRVTVRSANPGAVDGRAIVVLQTVVRVNL